MQTRSMLPGTHQVKQFLGRTNSFLRAPKASVIPLRLRNCKPCADAAAADATTSVYETQEEHIKSLQETLKETQAALAESQANFNTTQTELGRCSEGRWLGLLGHMLLLSLFIEIGITSGSSSGIPFVSRELGKRAGAFMGFILGQAHYSHVVDVMGSYMGSVWKGAGKGWWKSQSPLVRITLGGLFGAGWLYCGGIIVAPEVPWVRGTTAVCGLFVGAFLGQAGLPTAQRAEVVSVQESVEDDPAPAGA